jgi:hypothetical protein
VSAARRPALYVSPVPDLASGRHIERMFADSRPSYRSFKRYASRIPYLSMTLIESRDRAWSPLRSRPWVHSVARTSVSDVDVTRLADGQVATSRRSARRRSAPTRAPGFEFFPNEVVLSAPANRFVGWGLNPRHHDLSLTKDRR